MRALRRIPDAALRIDVFAIAQPEAAGLARDLETAAARDSRLRLLPAVAHEDMASVLTGYDALLVPSQTVETGPLVVLEARAARVPVIGSALGGIADNVVDGTDGWLVQPHDSDEAWAAALVRAARMPAELAAMRARVRPVRSGGLVARDMSQVYAAVLERHRTREVVAG
jgi:glycosyltransferase involved in cell wall biosynthesis